MKNKKETKEQETITIKVKKGSPDEVKLQQKGATYQVYEKEMKEGQDDDPLNPYGSGETTQTPHQVGPDTNDGFGVDPGKTPGMYQDGMDEADNIEEKKSKKDQNPWAVCTSSLGLEGRERDSYTKAEKAKFERCVMDVKKTMKEGKNPLQPVVESALRKLVEKHINPRMTKSELLNTLSEQGVIRREIGTNTGSKLVGNTKVDKPVGKYYTLTKKEAMEQSPTTAPPKVKPGTKEAPGKSDPFKNPKHKPKPKAETNEQAPTTAPPKVKPGTTEKPGKMDPFKNPKHQPKPKAGKNMVDDNPKAPVTKIPDYLTFDQLGITFENKK